MSSETDLERAVRHARWAQEQWAEANERAETARAVRNGAIHLAIRAGATQRELADELGISQPALSSILKRTTAPDPHDE